MAGLQRQTQSGPRPRPPDHVSSPLSINRPARAGASGPPRARSRCGAPPTPARTCHRTGRVCAAGCARAQCPRPRPPSPRRLRCPTAPGAPAPARRLGLQSTHGQHRDPLPPHPRPTAPREEWGETHRSPPPANTWPPTKRAAARRGTGVGSELGCAGVPKATHTRSVNRPESASGSRGRRGRGTGLRPGRLRNPGSRRFRD